MAKNWAIVVGINHYDHHPERQLKYAVSDAQLVHDFLCQAGFASDHIFLCLGTEEHKNSPTYPTYSTLLRLLNRDLHPDRIGQVDRLWFFFGGHGVSQNGRDYLLTSDSLLEDTELKIALPIDEVIASLQRHRSADIVLVLDNCRQQQGSRKLGADVGRQTAELARNRGITTIFSCDYGQYSYELDRLGQGVFTYALIEGLKQHTLPDKLEAYLRRRVAELNQRNDQVPRIRVEPATKALQPLLPSAVTPADITVLIDRAREAELEEDYEVAKQLWWQIIRVAKDDRFHEAEIAIRRIDRKIAQQQERQASPPPQSLPVSEWDKGRSTPIAPSPAAESIRYTEANRSSKLNTSPPSPVSSRAASRSKPTVPWGWLTGYLILCGLCGIRLAASSAPFWALALALAGAGVLAEAVVLAGVLAEAETGTETGTEAVAWAVTKALFTAAGAVSIVARVVAKARAGDWSFALLMAGVVALALAGAASEKLLKSFSRFHTFLILTATAGLGLGLGWLVHWVYSLQGA